MAKCQDLKRAVCNRTPDIERLREHLVANGETESTERVSATQLQHEIRAEYGIPYELSDSDVEEVLR